MTIDRVFFIAEFGANHDREFAKVIRGIDAAKAAGADAFKLQLYTADTLYARETPAFAGYDDVHALIESIELPKSWLHDCKAACDDRGIEFMCTPFDEWGIDELVAVGVKKIKVAGFESQDPRIVCRAAETDLPLIVSLGIGTTPKTTHEVLAWTERSPSVTLLHCNHAYPTPLEDTKIDTITTLRSRHESERVQIGYSDHTTSVLVPSLAVALGAVVIEKHFTLDKLSAGPDHPFALEPNELREAISRVREAETVKGNRDCPVTASERAYTPALRSIVAMKDIKSGEILSIQNTTTSRPYRTGAIAARFFFDAIESQARATKNISAGSLIEWEQISWRPT